MRVDGELPAPKSVDPNLLRWPEPVGSAVYRYSEQSVEERQLMVRFKKGAARNGTTWYRYRGASVHAESNSASPYPWNLGKSAPCILQAPDLLMNQ